MRKIPFGMVEANDDDDDDKVSKMVNDIQDIEARIKELQDVKRKYEEDLKRELMESGMLNFLKLDMSKLRMRNNQ